MWDDGSWWRGGERGVAALPRKVAFSFQNTGARSLFRGAENNQKIEINSPSFGHRQLGSVSPSGCARKCEDYHVRIPPSTATFAHPNATRPSTRTGRLG